MSRRTTVLVVDDEALVRQTYAKVLEQEGFDVVVHSGAVGLSMVLHDHQPDIVLLDLDLGDRQGDQALSDALLACGDALMVKPRIVVVSGLPEEEVAERGRAIGAHATVSKLQPVVDVVSACRRCR